MSFLRVQQYIRITEMNVAPGKFRHVVLEIATPPFAPAVPPRLSELSDPDRYTVS
jgi:hypothetical protein